MLAWAFQGLYATVYLRREVLLLLEPHQLRLLGGYLSHCLLKLHSVFEVKDYYFESNLHEDGFEDSR